MCIKAFRVRVYPQWWAQKLYLTPDAACNLSIGWLGSTRPRKKKIDQASGCWLDISLEQTQASLYTNGIPTIYKNIYIFFLLAFILCTRILPRSSLLCSNILFLYSVLIWQITRYILTNSNWITAIPVAFLRWQTFRTYTTQIFQPTYNSNNIILNSTVDTGTHRESVSRVLTFYPFSLKLSSYSLGMETKSMSDPAITLSSQVPINTFKSQCKHLDVFTG